MLGTTYVTEAGDTLEAICLIKYGSWRVSVMKLVWDANSWAVRHPLRLPAGRILVLPYLADSNVPATFDLWSDSP